MCERLLHEAQDINGVKVIRLDGEADPNEIRNALPIFKGKFADKEFAVVGGTTFNGKPTISVVLSQPLMDKGLHAGNLVKAAARLIQGGGGGQAQLATAGGKDASGLPAAVDQIIAEITK